MEFAAQPYPAVKAFREPETVLSVLSRLIKLGNGQLTIDLCHPRIMRIVETN